MDQSAPPIDGIIRRPMTGQPAAPAAPKGPRKPYLKRIFEGRMNRQNYAVGSLVIMGIPLLCILVFAGTFLASSGTLSWLTINPYDQHQLQNSQLQVELMQHSLEEMQSSLLNRILLIIVSLYTLITLPMQLGLQVRRLHDLNNSGWLFLLNLIPFVSYFFPFYIAFFPRHQRRQ